MYYDNANIYSVTTRFLRMLEKVAYSMRKSVKNSRYNPVQQRSKKTVDDLIDATARVIAKHGYDGATTNRIAEQAGVGIATLYRYFTDKDELVDAVFNRVVIEIENAGSRVIVDSVNDTLEGALRSVLVAAVETVERHGPIMRAYSDRLARPGGADRRPIGPDRRPAPMEARLVDIGRIAIIHGLGLSPDDTRTDAIAFLGSNTVNSLAFQIALKRPPEIERDELIDHAVCMLSTWLATYQP